MLSVAVLLLRGDVTCEQDSLLELHDVGRRLGQGALLHVLTCGTTEPDNKRRFHIFPSPKGVSMRRAFPRG